MSRNPSNIKFCCYELQGTTDDKQPQQNTLNQQKKQASMPMLSMGTNSKIVFSNIRKKNDQPIYHLLLQLYKNDQKSKINQILTLLSKKRINPDFTSVGQREDLQYYIPQLITYLVIQQNLQDLNLIEIIMDACSTDFYFAHAVYFYLNSFTFNWNNQPIQNVQNFINQQFLPKMNIYSSNRLSGLQFTKGMMTHEKDLSKFPALQIKKSIAQSQNDFNDMRYGTKRYPIPSPQLPIPINKFTKKKYSQNGFLQTPSFLEDLVTIGQDISSLPPQQRNQQLDYLLRTRVNQKLPASVYIPFFKDKLRMYTVLCVWKGRLFSTKQRAPFSIWVELYREQQELQLIQQAVEAEMKPMKCPKPQKKQKILQKIYQTLSKPFNSAENRNTINLKKHFQKKFRSSFHKEEQETQLKKSKHERFKFSSTFHEPQTRLGTTKNTRVSLSFIYDQNQSSDRNSNDIASSIQSEKQKVQQNIYQKEPLQDYFPRKSTQVIQEFKRRSVYRQLKSWRIAHLMVKTGDDLKQQQFAMQLINNFDNIFKKQKIECVVFPYEVISLGPNYGLIEMLQDVTTFDSLLKNLGQKRMTLKQFFVSYFPERQEAKRNFMKSLAGYCLITYFLQVKDRHNGNILLHRDGYLIHIDFGFFLSNMPGKGVQLQKNVPFKLLTQYVQVIGSLNSQSFFQFRRLFYKGFVAILKHKQSLISLVKMMYSSHGQSMGCFIKSQTAVFQLQKRLNPPGNVQQFCYDLINSSLDNWRSKWYDKFQYFLQKIYY